MSSRRLPVLALQVLIVGLALHNVVMAMLWRAGLRGTALTVVSAWKDVLLLAALALVVRERRRLPFDGRPTDWLALAFGAFVVLYGLLPQSWLGGSATHKGVLYAARHDLLPVGAYFLGRGLELTERERSRLCHTVLATAAFVAAFGLIDVYAVPLSFWRPAAGWFSDQLGLTYTGVSGLPENFVYNAGNGVVFRRLTSTFLSPLATSYLLVVALFFIPYRRRFGLPLGLLIFAALLWTHTRSALLALVVVLVLRAVLRRRARPLVWVVVVAAIGLAFVKGYDHFGPRTHFTAGEMKVQESIARQHPQISNNPTSANESSVSEHLTSLRDGARTVLHHPWGYGLGNSGVTAERTHVAVKAGESTYTELGVETGLAGMLVFIAWSVALLRATMRRRMWVGASFAAVLFLGLQTDVIGVPWIAVVVWAFAGDSAATTL
ncbi:MAG TPA: O-antigen ligase family protein [Gaiellaceae bacterium]|nr:O-antigen ligase family protein [Gaiellaceae bacterium]